MHNNTAPTPNMLILQSHFSFSVVLPCHLQATRPRQVKVYYKSNCKYLFIKAIMKLRQIKALNFMTSFTEIKQLLKMKFVICQLS